ncbi:hypothetical protein BK667_19040 [Pseudomonas frederiksbergensis]|nr:hypothetical protein BK667_19040 [Pseudomonas frederiksbergensis]
MELSNVENEVLITGMEELVPPIPEGRPISFQILWDGIAVGAPVTRVMPITFPISLRLPAGQTFTQGIYNLSYRRMYAGTPTDYTPPIKIIVDKEAPNRGLPGAAAILPAAIIDDRVTAEYVQANGGLKIVIPIPTDIRTGDKVEVYYGASDPAKKIAEHTVPVPADRETEISVTLTFAEFLLAAEGARIIYYRWSDRVGNIGLHSNARDVKAIHHAEPSNLKAPKVPVADPVIDIKDAFPHVTVLIDQYDNHKPTDEYVVSWGTREQAPKRVGDIFPGVVEVPMGIVAADGLGPIDDLPVTYKVLRSGLPYPETTGTLVDVDLRQPGTPPPDPETDPEVGNPNLNEVNVIPANSGTENILLPVDANEPATAKVLIDSNRTIGDIYTLFWNKVAVSGTDGTYTVDGSEDDATEIEFTIPWADIEAGRNGKEVPVHYEISNPAVQNPNPSTRQRVDVYVLPVILNPPVINHVEREEIEPGKFIDFLSCPTLKQIPNVGRAAIVTVAGGAPLAQGMVLNFEWTGHFYDTGGNPVPVTPHKFSKTLTVNEHIDGVTVYLPLTELERIKDGSGSIMYTVNIDRRDEPSGSHDVEVVVRDLDGGPCPLI